MTVLLVVVALTLSVGFVVVLAAYRRQHRRLSDVEARAEALTEAESAGRETERYRDALVALPLGVVLSDREGEVIFRNAVAAGFSGEHHGDMLVEAAVGEVLADAIERSRAHRDLDLFKPPRRSFAITAASLITDAETIGAVAVIEEVTEQRRVEELRRDFVANISHELKTPVGALALLAETLRDEDDPDVTRRLAERLLSEADRVTRTIEDLLVLSRLEAEELPEREPVPVHLLVAEAAARVRPAAEQAGIEVTVEEPGRRLEAVGDRRQLVSALANLVDNAVKYSDPGGSVRLSAATDGQTVDIEVEDSGIGIPARDLDRIFERFYRVDQGRSRETGGTGLGLSIVRHVAQNHRGDVVVRSRVGQGSVFTLCLPAGGAPVAVTAEAG